MTADTTELESIGHLVVSLQTPHSQVVRTIEQLKIKPALVLNGIPHFDGKQVSRISAAVRGGKVSQ